MSLAEELKRKIMEAKMRINDFNCDTTVNNFIRTIKMMADVGINNAIFYNEKTVKCFEFYQKHQDFTGIKIENSYFLGLSYLRVSW